MGRVARQEVAVSVVEPDPAQVHLRGDVEVASEGELDGADANTAARGDVSDADVLVRVLAVGPRPSRAVMVDGAWQRARARLPVTRYC